MYTLNMCLIHSFGHVKTLIIKTVVIKQYLSDHIVLLRRYVVTDIRCHIFVLKSRWTAGIYLHVERL